MFNMEKQTKHRILGVVVVIALVIILLPFFQSGKELAPETTLVKAPSFPEQSVQVTANAADAEEEATIDSPDLAAPTITETKVSQNTTPGPQTDMIKTTHPSVINETP